MHKSPDQSGQQTNHTDNPNCTKFASRSLAKKDSTSSGKQHDMSRNSKRQLFGDLLGYGCFFNTSSGRKTQDQPADRFIPHRKQSQFDCLRECLTEQPNQPRSKPKIITLADMYSRHVLRQQPKEEDESRLKEFVNRNKLKYRGQKGNQMKCRANNENQLLVNIKKEIVSTWTATERKVSKTPFKVLDAPNLQDDFYLNLIDWSKNNILAVALGSAVYLWNASTSRVNKLFELPINEMVTSVAWSSNSQHLSIGSSTGVVQLWDCSKPVLDRKLYGHTGRVGSMSWNNHNILATGSKDLSIMQRDLRDSSGASHLFLNHKQEVCGLKWSFDGQQLASGGNDNRVFIWNMHSQTPIYSFTKHTAAVKALAWSPHQYGLLATGGGTADRSIRFWSTMTGQQIKSVDTNSQVCNLIFSRSVNEIASTHGFSENQIHLWKYPSMQKFVTLTGHSLRVLYLAMSPDSSTIVTGAGDETLRFWNVFPPVIGQNMLHQQSLLNCTISLR